MNRFPFPPYRSGIPHWTERVVTYCAKVLPIVFDNSLSYYEFLGHLQVKLNEVIKALNSQNLVFVEFTHMIELELQNFEKYMEERQDNFEQQMQEEWQEFKTEMETAWNEFKTAMETAWQEYKDEMDQAWADFQADMLQRFQTFQDTITAQQTSFEQHMQAVQQQFEDDMENRADTFEQTITDQQNAFEQNVETELEEWKDIAIRAILDTIRLELPDLISDVIGSDFLAPIITRQGFLKMISASNETATGFLDLTNEPISVYKNGQRVSGISTLADLASIQIEPGTAIVFTRIALFSEISSGRFQYRASDFPASGYTLSVGVYVTDASITTVFEDSKYSENTHVSIENGTDGFINVTLGRTAWQDVTATLQYVTIVFQADPAAAAFTCDYSTGVELAKPPTADMVLEDQATGKRYTVEQAQDVTVDQQYDAQSANAQSGTAVADALMERELGGFTPESWLDVNTAFIEKYNRIKIVHLELTSNTNTQIPQYSDNQWKTIGTITGSFATDFASWTQSFTLTMSVNGVTNPANIRITPTGIVQIQALHTQSVTWFQNAKSNITLIYA